MCCKCLPTRAEAAGRGTASTISYKLRATETKYEVETWNERWTVPDPKVVVKQAKSETQSETKGKMEAIGNSWTEMTEQAIGIPHHAPSWELPITCTRSY